jgi:hypothetical protein
MSIRDRPKTIDYDALAKKAGAIEVDPSEVSNIPQHGGNEREDKTTRKLTDAEIDEALREAKERTVSKTPFVPPPLSSYNGDAPGDKGLLRIVKSEPLPGEVRSFWIARSVIAFLPPLVIYFFLFSVVSWVYRGFRLN